MVLTTWSKEQVLDMILNWVKSNFTTFALGTDSTGEDSSQIALGNEVFRDSVDEITTTSNSVLFRCYVGKTEANGNTLTEIGLFDANNNMLLRKVYGAISKTQDMDIWFEIEVVVSIS